MSRYEAPKGKDSYHFKKTANATKSINLKPRSMRGGIRL